MHQVCERCGKPASHVIQFPFYGPQFFCTEDVAGRDGYTRPDPNNTSGGTLVAYFKPIEGYVAPNAPPPPGPPCDTRAHDPKHIAEAVMELTTFLPDSDEPLASNACVDCVISSVNAAQLSGWKVRLAHLDTAAREADLDHV